MSHFKTTTPRSARIGQEGHSTDKDWIHFTEKYRPPCMKFLDRHYPKYRFLKDDVYEDMVVMILDNPGFANRKPSVRFRTVLIKLLRKAMASAVRKLREESGERYARLMQPLPPAETAFDCDRRRLQLIAVDFIRRDLDVACVFDVERDWDAARACAPAVPVRTNATDAAFAIYTSGSTGTPKGVVHEFGTLDLNVRSISHRAQSLFRCGERAACIAPMGTVATVIQFTKALSCGAPHVVVPARELVSPERLTAVLARERIRFVFITPNLARSVSRFEPPLRTLVLSSERADGLYFPEVPEIFNVYSASELGCIASIHRLSRAETPCPVGQPTFDFALPLEEGEICAVQPFFRGYVADLRAGRRRRPDELLHTNDLARLTDDGELVVTGRADDMIKVRGNRVEPAEVERAVRELLPVSWAFVKGLDGEGIALYYQAKADLDVRASRQKLGERLPRYMVPTAFMRLEKVPALPNGKLDRRALPPITGDKAEQGVKLEALCKSAAEVLNVEKVSPDDDLRELGMDSVSFVEMLMDAKIRITAYSQLPRCTTPRAIVTALQKAGF